jgi:hypothetical protein
MATQPFVGPCPLLQFHNNFLHRWYDSFDGRSVRRKTATYNTWQHKHEINAHTNILALSGIRTHPVLKRAKAVYVLDRTAIVMSTKKFPNSVPTLSF